MPDTTPAQPVASVEEATQQFGQALQSLDQVQGGSQVVVDALNQLRVGVTDEPTMAYFEGQRIAQLFVGHNPDTQEFADFLISEQLAGRSLTGDIENTIQEGFVEAFDTINDRRVWLHYREDLRLDSPREAILAFVRLARSGSFVPPHRRSPRLVFDTLDALDSRQLHNATMGGDHTLNIDLEGYRRFIWLDGVSHAFSSHGPGNEDATGQIPISPEAIAMYLDVISDPDEVVFSPESLRGGESDALAYHKKIDGRLVVVEEILTGGSNRGLAFLSLRIEGQRP